MLAPLAPFEVQGKRIGRYRSWRYAHFDFGNSFYLGDSVIDVIRQKLPVSLSLGLWSTLLTYVIAVPLGIRKALRHGSRFDVWTSAAVVVAYAVPTFLFAVMPPTFARCSTLLNWLCRQRFEGKELPWAT